MNCFIQNATLFPLLEQTYTRATTKQDLNLFRALQVVDDGRVHSLTSCASNEPEITIYKSLSSRIEVYFDTSRATTSDDVASSYVIKYTGATRLVLEGHVCVFCVVLCRNRVRPRSSSQRCVSDTLRRRHGNQLQQQW